MKDIFQAAVRARRSNAHHKKINRRMRFTYERDREGDGFVQADTAVQVRSKVQTVPRVISG